MSEAAAVTPAPTREATIHDAIESLFASKEPSKPEAVVDTPIEETPVVEGAEPEVIEEPAPVIEAAPAKVSASDYAIQLARAKKKLAAAKAAVPAPVQAMPSAAAIKRATAIEAAGGDSLKAFQAAGLDLATVVRAYENEQAANPDYADPLAKEVKTLAAKLAHYEERDKAAKDVAATDSFFGTAKQMMAKSGDAYEYVAAYGTEGLDLVKELVLTAAEGTEDNPPHVLPLAEALKLAEAHFAAKAEIAATTKKLAKKFQPQTRKPGLAQQAPAAGAAPATQTKTRSLDDVISNAIDALIG